MTRDMVDLFEPPPPVEKVYRWGSKTPIVHIPSEPSTVQFTEELSKAIAQVDYGSLLSRLAVSPKSDLLDPPDGAYPFIEYADLPAYERSILLTCRVTWAMKRLPKDSLMPSAERVLAIEIERVGEQVDEDQWEATALVAEALRKAVKDSEEIRRKEQRINSGPQPARPGHLMAEGRALSIAKEAIQNGNRMGRKVVFREPVNAFTMLHGDSIAHGGDMLTAVTITDTEEQTIQNFSGHYETRYYAHAVNIWWR